MPQPLYVVPAATVGLASSVAANASITSATIFAGAAPSGFWRSGSVGLILAATGQLSVQRYLDTTANLPVGAPLQVALSSGVGVTVGWSDNLVFQSLKITVTNSTGSSAAVSNVVVALSV